MSDYRNVFFDTIFNCTQLRIQLKKNYLVYIDKYMIRQSARNEIAKESVQVFVCLNSYCIVAMTEVRRCAQENDVGGKLLCVRVHGRN
jgi:hypothetical protein